MNRFIFILGILCLSLQSLSAQELQAEVQVLSTRVQGVDPKVFTTLKTALTEFLNNRRWSSDNFMPNERIQCTFFLNITEAVGAPEDNVFKGTLTVQSTRPVYNSNYSSTTFNFLDREVAFKYDPSQVLLFDDNRVAGTDALIANLPALIAYYAYMILGFDYDSFQQEGGDVFFKKAQNIVMNAPEDSRVINGWKSNSSRKINRYWLVDQILDPKFSQVRKFWYNYHIKGLDLMRKEPQKGLQNIAPFFTTLNLINKENPSSIYLMTVFNTKSTEFLNLVAQLPPEEKQKAIQQLSEVDVSNAAKYKAIK